MVRKKYKFPVKIKSKKYFDKRGFFQECFKSERINFNPKFSAFSLSKKNVIRGLHLQLKKKQEIFLILIKGKIIDVCIDVRFKKKTFGKKYINILNEGDMLYIPKGFAHGYGALDNENIIFYNFSSYRHKSSEVGIKFNDKTLNINWKINKPIISRKDKKNISFTDLTN